MPKPPKKLKNFIYPIAILLGLAVVFHKYISLSYLFIFEDIGNDTLMLFYPNLMDDIRTIRESGIPFYSFSKGIGQGNFNEDILSPFTWFYAILGPKYLAYGIGFVQFFKVIIIALLSFSFFRIQNFDKRAAILGSILVTFSGYVIVGSSWYGHVSNIMYMLLFLVGLELWITRRRWWLLPVAILFLLGPPLFFLAEFTLIYLFIRISFARNISGKQILNLGIKSWKPIGVSLLISAPFLSAVVYKFIYSPRVGGSASYTNELSATPIFSFANADQYSSIIYRFFSNDLLGSGDAFSGWGNYLESPLFYCGLLSLLLLPQVFSFLHRRQKIVVSTVLFFWAIILIFPYFRFAFYLFMGDYFKGALSFFIPFTMVIMAVITLDRMFKGNKLNLYLLYGTAGVLSFLLIAPNFLFTNVNIDLQVQITVLVFLILQVLGLTIIQIKKQKELWIMAIIFLSLIEGVIFSYPALNERKAIKTERFRDREMFNDYSIEALKYIESLEDGFFRVEKTYGSVLSGLNDSQVQNYFDTKSYRSHNHKNYINFFTAFDMINPSDEYSTRWLTGIATIPELHSFFQIKFMLAKPGDEVKLLDANYNNLGELNGIHIHQSKFPIPFGFPVSHFVTETEFKGLDSYYKRLNALYTCAIVPDHLVDQFPELKRMDPSNFYNAFGLERFYNQYLNRGLNITSFSESKIKGSIKVEDPSMMVLSFPFDAGWRATVDGQRRELDFIDNGLTGLYVEEGSHQIVLKYRPPFYEIGLFLFFIGLGVLIYFGIIKKSKKDSPFLNEMNLKSNSDQELSKNIDHTKSSKKK